MAVQVNELRIGNKIMYDGWHPDLQLHNKPIVPYPVTVKYLECDDDNDDKIIIGTLSDERGYESNFEPIPLSASLLEKCGCAQGEDKEMWRNSMGIWLIKVANKDEYFIAGFHSGHTIKYLHQYQNAVFVLTGEELNITL